MKVIEIELYPIQRFRNLLFTSVCKSKWAGPMINTIPSHINGLDMTLRTIEFRSYISLLRNGMRGHQDH